MKLPASPKVSAPPMIAKSIATFQVQERRYPVPMRSEMYPKMIPPATRPAK